MAINANNGNEQVSAPSFDPSGATATAAPAPAVQSSAWTFGDARLTGPISYSQGSENLIKLRDKITAMFKDVQSSELQINVLTLDNQQISGIYYSSVVVCMRMPNSAVNGVSFYTMLLAGSREAPTSKTENIVGQTYEIKVAPGDAFDNVYVEKVVQVVQQAFPNAKLFNVGGTMVPADFNSEDLNAVHRLAYNASAATFSELKVRQPGFKDINLAASKGDNNLQVNLVFGRETIENSVSEPMRSDVDVSLVTAASSNNPNDSLNNQARRADRFGKITGFIDTVWAPVQVQQNAWGGYDPMMMQMATQKYAARFVITHMESTQVSTLPAYLLLLLTSLPVGMNQAWYHAFYNQNRFGDKKGQIDLTDVGALNIEANLPSAKAPTGNPNGIGDRLDTRSKDFTQEVFGTYIRKLFREGVVFSLDVPLCGPQTWYLDVFKAASENNQDAIKIIIDAADYLTNGNFSSIYGNGGGMFAEQGNLIHLGTYEDQDGKKRDIRDIDHLAVLNAFGETDMSIVRKWSDSFLLLSKPLSQRLAERWNIIQAITKNRATFTGFAVRVTFRDNFMQALNNAAAAAGLNVKTNVPTTGLMMGVDRGVGNFVNQALVTGGQASTFYAGGGIAVGPNSNYGTKTWNRY